jgi:hypothetical protein
MAFAAFMEPSLLHDEKNYLTDLKLSKIEIQNIFKGAITIIAFQFTMIFSIIIYVFY